MHDRRSSFERAAAAYEQARPPYVEEALDWALTRLSLTPHSRLLDLGAGTGKLTRQLVSRGLDVVAVEPGREMQAVFQQALPGVEVLAGTAEQIPLPDRSVDAVTVGQAFHWFDTRLALAEMRRVTKPGGGFALFWNQFSADPLLISVDQVMQAHLSAEPSRPPWRDRYDEALFGPLVEHTFDEQRRMSVDQIVAWVASASGVILAPRQKQVAIEREIRQICTEYDGVVTIRTYGIVAPSA